MSKLNLQQKMYLKTIESELNRKKTKKAFKIVNDNKEFSDSKKLLTKLFKSFNKNKYK